MAKKKKKKKETKAEMRVAVAKDVLAQLAAKKLKLIHGDYFHVDLKRPVEGGQVDGVVDLQSQLLSGNAKTCNACAVGSLMVGYAKLYDKVASRYFASTKYGNGDEVVTQYELVHGWPVELERIFPYATLRALEGVFESEAVRYADSVTGAKKAGPGTQVVKKFCEEVVRLRGKLPSRAFIAALHPASSGVGRSATAASL